MSRDERTATTYIERPDRVCIEEPQRRIYWFNACLLYPHVGVGWESPNRAESGGMQTHAHDEGIEISFFVNGRVTWRVDDASFDVRRGDVFITLPGQVHGGEDDVKEPCERFYLELIVPADGEPLPGMTRRETETLAQAFGEIASPVFPGNGAIDRLFHKLLALHNANRPARSDELLRLDARTLLHRLLLEVLHCGRLHARARNGADPGRRFSVEIDVALDWIDRNLARSFDIPSVARRAGLSISAFHRRFLHEVGMTPSEYRTRQRIERARELLAHPDQSITSVAHALGFSTSQYFATVFRKYVGVTPREFRAGARAPAADS